MRDQFLAASRESTGEITKLAQRFDAVFQQIGKSADAGLASVVANLTKLDSKFAKTVADAQARQNSLKFDKMADGFQALGQQAGSAFKGAVSGGAQYETTINRIRAISDLTGQDIEQLNQNIEDLGRKFGFAVGPTQTAETALQAVGSGFESVSDASKIAQSSLALIADGTTSAEAATKLLVGTLNAYGKGSNEAAKLTDQFFQIQNRGVVSISEMSNTLGLVTKTASAAGIGVEELGAV